MIPVLAPEPNLNRSALAAQRLKLLQESHDIASSELIGVQAAPPPQLQDSMLQIIRSPRSTPSWRSAASGCRERQSCTRTIYPHHHANGFPRCTSPIDLLIDPLGLGIIDVALRGPDSDCGHGSPPASFAVAADKGGDLRECPILARAVAHQVSPFYLGLTDLFRARWTDTIPDAWIRNVFSQSPDLKPEDLEPMCTFMSAMCGTASSLALRL